MLGVKRLNMSTSRLRTAALAPDICSTPPCAATIRLASSAEPLGLSLRLHPHLDGVRPRVQRRLYDLHRGLQHLPAPADENRDLGSRLARQARVARRPYGGLDLLPRRAALGLG